MLLLLRLVIFVFGFHIISYSQDIDTEVSVDPIINTDYSVVIKNAVSFYLKDNILNGSKFLSSYKLSIRFSREKDGYYETFALSKNQQLVRQKRIFTDSFLNSFSQLEEVFKYLFKNTPAVWKDFSEPKEQVLIAYSGHFFRYINNSSFFTSLNELIEALRWGTSSEQKEYGLFTVQESLKPQVISKLKKFQSLKSLYRKAYAVSSVNFKNESFISLKDLLKELIQAEIKWKLKKRLLIILTDDPLTEEEDLQLQFYLNLLKKQNIRVYIVVKNHHYYPVFLRYQKLNSPFSILNENYLFLMKNRTLENFLLQDGSVYIQGNNKLDIPKYKMLLHMSNLSTSNMELLLKSNHYQVLKFLRYHSNLSEIITNISKQSHKKHWVAKFLVNGKEILVRDIDSSISQGLKEGNRYYFSGSMIFYNNKVGLEGCTFHIANASPPYILRASALEFLLSPYRYKVQGLGGDSRFYFEGKYLGLQEEVE